MLGAIYISNKMGPSLAKSILGSVAAKKKRKKDRPSNKPYMAKKFFKIILRIHNMAQRNCHIPCSRVKMFPLQTIIHKQLLQLLF